MPEESKKAKGRGGRSFMPLYERRRQAKKKSIEEITDPAGGRRLAQLVGRSGHSQSPSQEAPAASHARSAGGRLFSRKGVAVAGAAAAGVGGAAYLAGRAQRRKSNTVAKLYDPFAGEYVEVGKAAYPVAWPPPRSTGLQARTPQGKFVSHANDLKVVHYHPKRNPTSKLVQIKHGPRSVSGSSVGKSLGSGAVKIGSRITGA